MLALGVIVCLLLAFLIGLFIHRLDGTWMGFVAGVFGLCLLVATGWLVISIHELEEHRNISVIVNQVMKQMPGRMQIAP